MHTSYVFFQRGAECERGESGEGARDLAALSVFRGRTLLLLWKICARYFFLWGGTRRKAFQASHNTKQTRCLNGGRMVSRRGPVVACQMTLKDFEMIGMIRSCAAAYKKPLSCWSGCVDASQCHLECRECRSHLHKYAGPMQRPQGRSCVLFLCRLFSHRFVRAG